METARGALARRHLRVPGRLRGRPLLVRLLPEVGGLAERPAPLLGLPPPPHPGRGAVLGRAGQVPGRLPGLHGRVRLRHRGGRGPRPRRLRHRAGHEPLRVDLRAHLRRALRAGVPARQRRHARLDPGRQALGVRAARQRDRAPTSPYHRARRPADAAAEGRLPGEDRGRRARASPGSPWPTTWRARATRSRSSRRARCPGGMLTLGVPLYRLPRELVKRGDRRHPVPRRRAEAQRAGGRPGPHARGPPARGLPGVLPRRRPPGQPPPRHPGRRPAGRRQRPRVPEARQPGRADRHRPPGGRDRRRQRRVRRGPHGACAARTRRTRAPRTSASPPTWPGPRRAAAASPRCTSPASSRSRRCRRTRIEIDEGQHEGLRMHTSLGPPDRPRQRQGPRASSSCSCLSVFDSERRFNPQFDETARETIECDTVIFAIGQRADFRFLRPEDGIELTEPRPVKVDPETLQTSAPRRLRRRRRRARPPALHRRDRLRPGGGPKHPRLPAAHHDRRRRCAPPGRPRRTRWAQDWEVRARELPPSKAPYRGRAAHRPATASSRRTTPRPRPAGRPSAACAATCRPGSRASSASPATAASTCAPTTACTSSACRRSRRTRGS